MAPRPPPTPMPSRSKTIRTRRPPTADSLVEKGSLRPASVGGGPGGSCLMNCADTTRRGVPSIVRTKSSGVRSAIGSPRSLTTVASIAMSSVAARKVGCAGGVARLLRREARPAASTQTDASPTKVRVVMASSSFLRPPGSPADGGPGASARAAPPGSCASVPSCASLDEAYDSRYWFESSSTMSAKTFSISLDVVEQKRAAAAHLRHARHHLREVPVLDAASEADRVDGRVAGLEPRLHALERRHRVLVLAVAEHHQRAAARLLADGVERGEHRVKQRRAAPGRQPVDGAQAQAPARSPGAPA